MYCSIIELTGDSDMSQSLQHVAKASIIITTPEKWDSITRTWKRHLFLLGSIDLLLIDEGYAVQHVCQVPYQRYSNHYFCTVHHISEDRGAVLEAVVVRMQKLNEILSLKSKGLNNSTKPYI